MVSFTCPSCRKQLSVKDERASQKVKCPGCGTVIDVPGKVGAPSAGSVPAAGADLPTLAPAPGKALAQPADAPTDPPPSQSDDTRAPGAAGAGHDSSLTDFLAPAQGDGELCR